MMAERIQPGGDFEFAEEPWCLECILNKLAECGVLTLPRGSINNAIRLLLSDVVCDEKLFLDEFKDFGGLRKPKHHGNRTSLNKICKALTENPRENYSAIHSAVRKHFTPNVDVDAIEKLRDMLNDVIVYTTHIELKRDRYMQIVAARLGAEDWGSDCVTLTIILYMLANAHFHEETMPPYAFLAKQYKTASDTAECVMVAFNESRDADRVEVAEQIIRVEPANEFIDWEKIIADPSKIAEVWIASQIGQKFLFHQDTIHIRVLPALSKAGIPVKVLVNGRELMRKSRTAFRSEDMTDEDFIGFEEVYQKWERINREYDSVSVHYTNCLLLHRIYFIIFEDDSRSRCYVRFYLYGTNNRMDMPHCSYASSSAEYKHLKGEFLHLFETRSYESVEACDEANGKSTEI